MILNSAVSISEPSLQFSAFGRAPALGASQYHPRRWVHYLEIIGQYFGTSTRRGVRMARCLPVRARAHSLESP